MKILFVIFLLPFQLFAQDITGVWAGTMYNDTTKQFIKYELAISEYKGKLSGYSHTIFIIDSVKNIGVKSIKIKKSGEEYFVEEEKLVYNNYTEPPAKGVRIFSQLVLSQNDSAMILSGPWKTNRTKVYESLTGKIFLQKKKKIKETLIIAKLENLGLAGSLSFMNTPDNKDLVLAGKPVSISGELKKNDAAITKEVVSNSPISTNPDSRNADKQGNADNQNSKKILSVRDPFKNKNDTVKETSEIRRVQLQIADTTFKKDAIANVISTGNSSAKTQAQQIDKQTKTDKKIPDVALSIGTPLKKNDNKVVNKVNITGVPSTVPIMPIPQNKDTNIISIKLEAPQISKQQKAVKEIPAVALSVRTIPEKKDSIVSTHYVINAAPQAAAGIATRTIETIKSVEIKSDSLVLTLYDNGVVDGDTVSVLLNGKVIMPMEGLSTKAINKTIYLTPQMGDSLILIMYAENLGSIPPNTGLLVVHDGEDTYYISFSGDLKKNAAIILKRKKKI